MNKVEVIKRLLRDDPEKALVALNHVLDKTPYNEAQKQAARDAFVDFLLAEARQSYAAQVINPFLANVDALVKVLGIDKTKPLTEIMTALEAVIAPEPEP